MQPTRTSPAPFFRRSLPRHRSPERTCPLSARQHHAPLGCSSAHSPPRDAWWATPPSLPPSLTSQWPLFVSTPPECGRQRQLPARRACLPPSLLSLPRCLTSIHLETMTAAWLQWGRWGRIWIRGLSPLASFYRSAPPPPPPLLLLPLDLWDVVVARVSTSSPWFNSSPCCNGFLGVFH
jgi:hypothetical protein